MQIKNPNYEAALRERFQNTPFMKLLGINLTGVGVGWVEAEMALTADHLQQNGYTHAGVQATIADHCSGAAAGTLMAAGDGVLSVEFKIHMLRPSQGVRLRCRAEVLKPGNRFSIVEAEVYTLSADGDEKLTAKMISTMAVIQGLHASD